MSAPVNETMLQELQELMGEDFPLLVETFITDCDSRLNDLNLAISNSNAKEIRELAHAFKGSSGNLGAKQLSDIAFEIEKQGSNNDLIDIAISYSKLCDEYLLVKRYFKSIN